MSGAFGDRLRASLSEGRTVFGTFIKLPGTEVLDVVISAGLDFAVADLEHSQLSGADARRLATHAAVRDFPLLVRLPAVDPGTINRMLEAGAAGIQLSMLRSVAQRRALVDASHYPPHGRRSISLAHPQGDYGGLGMNDYLKRQRGGPLLIGQIETPDTDDPLEQVLESLDVAFVGTADLSLNSGHPGEPEHPEVQARLREIARAATTVGATFGGWLPSPPAMPVLTALGARYLVVGSDVQILRSSIQALTTDLRSVAE